MHTYNRIEDIVANKEVLTIFVKHIKTTIHKKKSKFPACNYWLMVDSPQLIESSNPTKQLSEILGDDYINGYIILRGRNINFMQYISDKICNSLCIDSKMVRVSPD